MAILIMDPRDGLDVEAINALREELGTSVLALPGGFASFPSLRVSGPAGELLVAAHHDEKEIIFLAQRPGSYAEFCDTLGNAGQISAVAGIVRQRVGAMAPPKNS